MKPPFIAILLLAAVPVGAGVIDPHMTRVDAPQIVLRYPSLDAIPAYAEPSVCASIDSLAKALSRPDAGNAAWAPALQERIAAFAASPSEAYPSVKMKSVAFVAQAQAERARRDAATLPSLRALASPGDAESRGGEFYDAGGGPYRGFVAVEIERIPMEARAAARLITNVEKPREDALVHALSSLTKALSDDRRGERILENVALRRRVVRLSQEAPASSVADAARAFLAKIDKVELARGELDKRRAAAFVDGFFSAWVGFPIYIMIGALVAHSLGANLGTLAGIASVIANPFVHYFLRREAAYENRIEALDDAAELKRLPPGK